ncbi:GNAT family N-acetyltransferase [Luteipulveratus flavus]|uniref:GNAT family N-acetyltransferase n=1 Tax=Luteipulveratus flavus TaxID=3031728 RepID=A0ABT6C2S0_9MICO|nr:GNAT family N-acetyltransferase [Luteipulveratus sp. YIM 133296]MDF8263120.1 GNAT family N-acetyltransferase [Luteipulveratus sp. YIM 133296]
MIRLIEPDAALHTTWLEAMAEFDGARLHGFGTHRFEGVDLSDPSEFGRWLEEQQRGRTDPPEGLVPASLYWIVDDAEPGRVLGSLSLRHELNEFLLNEGGHIGYGVRPSARGRGVATAALRASLDEARALGLERVLVTCDDDNEASRRTILGGGGVLEDVRNGRERYWIDLQD